MSKRESINQEPLTIEELKTMAGLPVWCPEEEAYGIVMCDKIGQWAGIPFLHGVWYSDDDGVGVEFNHNIIGRKLKCFRVEDKKEIAMPPQINPMAALFGAMMQQAAKNQQEEGSEIESDDDE